jgi:hypothetical protein
METPDFTSGERFSFILCDTAEGSRKAPQVRKVRLAQSIWQQPSRTYGACSAGRLSPSRTHANLFSRGCAAVATDLIALILNGERLRTYSKRDRLAQ